jgi:uncharacterized membrane protein
LTQAEPNKGDKVVELIFWDWLNTGVRWLHVMAGIAWIGGSFYFVHTDSSLKKTDGLPPGAGGETWQVHGGGFYHLTKYMVAPARMPENLTWFKWEAYATWLSGFALLAIVYYLGAELYLIDKNVLDLPVWLAVLLSLLGLALGWLAYDRLCKSPLGRDDLKLGLAALGFIIVSSFVFTLVLSGRGAFMQMGALVGTIMAANVAMVIMPNQRKVVAELIAGRQPDPKLGAEAKQRSMHNNYFTLGVVFAMIANHYPLVFASRWNWLIFVLVLAIGAVIRHFYNTRHKGLPSPWWTWGVAAAGMLLVIFLSTRGPAESGTAADTPPAPASFAQVEEIVLGRCSMCHTAEPAWEGLATPPKGVMLDTPERIQAQARNIVLQAAYTHAMPPRNLTEITPEERAALAAWAAAGAPGG